VKEKPHFPSSPRTVVGEISAKWASHLRDGARVSSTPAPAGGPGSESRVGGREGAIRWAVGRLLNKWEKEAFAHEWLNQSLPVVS